MREIKFRAKGIEEYDKDKWYYGYYVKLDKTTYCFKEDYERNKDNSEHKIVFDVMTDWGLPNQHKMADINIDTIGQFTGLYDKNSTPIYEGDILENTAVNFKFIVKFIKTKWVLQKLEFPEDNLDMYDFFHRIPTMFEVIGNIYDNKIESGD